MALPCCRNRHSRDEAKANPTGAFIRRKCGGNPVGVKLYQGGVANECRYAQQNDASSMDEIFDIRALWLDRRLKASSFQIKPPLLQANASTIGTKNHMTVFAADLLWHV